MLSKAQQELWDSIVRLHKFETDGGTVEDFKSFLVSMRTSLNQVRGEFLATVLNLKTDSSSLASIDNPFRVATEACSTFGLLISVPNVHIKTTATLFYEIGQFSTVEALLDALSRSANPTTQSGKP